VVPKGGIQLPDGPYIAEDTIVGINPWVLHLNEKIYGPDAMDFRPERWLPNDGEDAEDFTARSRAMRDTDMAFGAGDRACLGKQVAMVEIHKLITTLFLLFEVRNNASHPCTRIIANTHDRLAGVGGPDQRLEGHQQLVRETGRH
jgi:cytochrome P450